MSKNRRQSGKRPVRRELSLQPRKLVLLEDGTTGYRMTRADDCMRAAVGTLLQRADVPDPQLDRRVLAGDDADTIVRDAWDGLLRWLDERGLDMLYHEAAPWGHERWIGVCPGSIQETDMEAAMSELNRATRRAVEGLLPALRNSGRFADHCVVMTGRTILFDPAKGFRTPHGMAVRTRRAADVASGYTIVKKGEI